MTGTAGTAAGYVPCITTGAHEVKTMDENEFKNRAYKVLLPTLEDAEHNEIPIKNGHHLTQRFCSALWDEFKNDIRG